MTNASFSSSFSSSPCLLLFVFVKLAFGAFLAGIGSALSVVTPIDYTKNPQDPSCITQPPPPVDCKAHPEDPSCKIDCSKNPQDPSCKVDCTKNPQDPSCHTCPKDQHYNGNQKKCIPDNCPKGQSFDSSLGKCVPTPPQCPEDQHYDIKQRLLSLLSGLQQIPQLQMQLKQRLYLCLHLIHLF